MIGELLIERTSDSGKFRWGIILGQSNKSVEDWIILWDNDYKERVYLNTLLFLINRSKITINSMGC